MKRLGSQHKTFRMFLMQLPIATSNTQTSLALRLHGAQPLGGDLVTNTSAKFQFLPII